MKRVVCDINKLNVNICVTASYVIQTVMNVTGWHSCNDNSELYIFTTARHTTTVLTIHSCNQFYILVACFSWRSHLHSHLHLHALYHGLISADVHESEWLWI